MIGPTCSTCGYVHTAADVIAVGRFQRPGGGYRVRGHDRLYLTRAAAEAALCAERAHEHDDEESARCPT